MKILYGVQGTGQGHISRARAMAAALSRRPVKVTWLWDKPVLTKPLQGQMEQHSNALALAQLGYARSTDTIDAGVLEDWLKRPNEAASIRFPNVAEALAHWLFTGCSTPLSTLGQRLWQRQEMSSATPIESDVEIATLRPSMSV